MFQYNFNPSIFKAYDVRGMVCDGEINEEAAFFIGLCLGEKIKSGKVCVGMDARKSSKLLSSGVARGLIEMGIDVIDLGLIPTPLCYFSIPFLNADASVMVTGSHNPENYNGFKITLKEGSLSGDVLANFVDVAGGGIAPVENKGKYSKIDILKDYKREATKSLNFEKKSIKIGIDAMNGSGGEVLKELCGHLPFNFIIRNAEMTGEFAKVLPEPSSPVNILALQNFLKTEELDVVFAFDGDADRVLMITSSKVWYGDDITLLLAFAILPEQKSGKVIFDVKSSIVLEKEIGRMGGEPIIYRTGHSLIKQKMQEVNAVLAGEMSGHIYINDGKFYPFDDGIYCFLRLLEYISKSDKLPDFPLTFKTPEVKLKVKDRKLFLSEFKSAILNLNPIRVLEIDGIKAYFGAGIETGAVLARASNTEDAIIVRIESYEEKEFKKLYDAIFSNKTLTKLLQI